MTVEVDARTLKIRAVTLEDPGSIVMSGAAIAAIPRRILNVPRAIVGVGLLKLEFGALNLESGAGYRQLSPCDAPAHLISGRRVVVS